MFTLAAMPRTRAKTFLLRLALAAAAALLAGSFAEAALRVVGYSRPNFYRADPVCGRALVPGAYGWQTAEGRSYVQINSAGFRDRDRAIPKPPGTMRVAVLGDSFTEGLQVPLADTFCARLETALAGCEALNGRRVEVLNFGVSGYGTALELLVLRNRVWAFEPDVVLLAFFAGNDVVDNSRALNKIEYIPYFVEREGRLELDDSFLKSAAYRSRSSLATRAGLALMGRCRVMQLANAARKAVRDRARNAAAAGKGPGELGLADQVYSEPNDPEFARAWRVTELLVKAMEAETRARDASFMLVSLSAGRQVTPDKPAREADAKRLGVADLFYPERRLGALAKSEGFPYLALAPLLQAKADASGVRFHGFAPSLGAGHWNADGHRAAAELIAPWLCSNIPPSRAPH